MNAYAMVLWLCALSALAVFGTMIYSIVAFRAPRGVEASAVRNKFAEVVWALIPIAIVCCAALPAVQSITAREHPISVLARSS